MFQSITAKGFGPTDATLTIPDPMGPVTFSGPSRAGKTTLTLRLLCLLLWGCEPNGGGLDGSIIQADADTATISATTAKGTTFTRVFKVVLTTDETGAKVPKLDEYGNRSFSATCTIQKATDPAPLKLASEADWQAQMPVQLQMLPNQRGDSAVRMAFVPNAWRELATGNARALRDLIARVSGVTGDLRGTVAKLMGDHALLESDPLVDEDPEVPRGAPKVLGAASLVKTARADAKTAEGAEREARNAMDALPTPPPAANPETLAEARRVIADGAAWTKHDSAVTAWTEGETKRLAAVTARDAWRAERDALNAREPAVDVTAHRAAEAQAERVGKLVDGERRILGTLEAAVTAARATLAATRAVLASPKVARVAAVVQGAVEVVEPVPAEPAPAYAGPAAVGGRTSFGAGPVTARRCPACNQTVPVSEAM